MNRLFHIFSSHHLRNRKFQLRLGLMIGFVLLLTLMLPRSYRLNLNFEVGKPWIHEDLKTPFDFYVLKSADSLEAEKNIAAAQVHDIYLVDSTNIRFSIGEVEQKIDRYVRQLDTLQRAKAAGDSLAQRQLMRQFFSVQYAMIPPESFQNVGNLESWRGKLKQKSGSVIRQVYQKGYIALNPSSTSHHFLHVRTSPALEKRIALNQFLSSDDDLSRFLVSQLGSTQNAENQLLLKIMLSSLEPNYVYSERLTEAERELRRSLVSPVLREYKTNDPIIQQGQVIGQDTEAALLAFIQESRLRASGDNSWAVSSSQMLVIALITAMLLIYLAVNRPRIYFDNNKLALIFFTFLMTVGLMVLAARLGNLATRLEGNQLSLNFLYLAPACLVPIFMRNFFGLSTAFLCNLIVAMFGAVLIQQNLEYAFVQLVAGTVAIFSMTALRKREQFWYTLLYIFLAYVVSFLVYNFYSTSGFSTIPYRTILLFLANTLATVIAFNLIFLFEKIFGITSDLTYLELLDTNHPLLKEMFRKAPGTFQHSLQVANIAEAVISEIGGNELLIHVGALYHDVGKMAHPQYFIENMSEEDKRHNPHDEISNLESAQIIIGHVTAGVELASKHHLPKEIVQFIQTHHGNTRVEYFYRNYLKQQELAPDAEKAEEIAFRYPGPKPFSKETAVLMMADSIEAASRTIKDPTPESLETLVNNIIDFKIKDGQLEDSNLTFKDITTIRKVIHKQLTSIYHARIKYPDEVRAEVS
jgi:putative nucleotidyltransferase with HDIG domain